MLGDTGTAVFHNAVHGDVGTAGTRGHRRSLLPLSPGLVVALGPSPLPPATQAALRDDERAGSGPQGQGHRRPAPGERGGTHTGPGVTSPSPVLTPVSPFVPPPVFSEGGRPAHPLRLPPHGGQRLPGAADGHRGVSPGRFGDPHPRAGGRGCVCVCDEEPTAPPAPGGGSPARAPRGCRRCPCAEPCVTAQECNAGGTRGSGLRLAVGWERRASGHCWTRGAAGRHPPRTLRTPPARGAGSGQAGQAGSPPPR